MTHRAAWCAVRQQVCVRQSHEGQCEFSTMKTSIRRKVTCTCRRTLTEYVASSQLALGCDTFYIGTCSLCVRPLSSGCAVTPAGAALLPRRTRFDPWLYGICGGQSGSACSTSISVFPCHYHSTSAPHTSVTDAV